MNDIEDILKAKKSQIEVVPVPEELELRLRKSLNKKKAPLFKRFKLQIAFLIMMIAVVTFNYDVIASYSRQLLGYDQVMSGTLKELSELGKGQFIGESFTFDDGVEVTVDYVMLDENQLLLFYSVKDPKGNVETIDLSPFMTLEGLRKTYHIQSSVGYIEDDQTVINYIASFDPPSFYEQKLRFNFAYNAQDESKVGEISFTIDRTKAMGHTLKKEINQTVRVDETKLKIKTILASPTKTVIEGSVQNIFSLALDTLSGERFRPQQIDLRLIANGKEVNNLGGGMSTDMKGITFHTDFDALPSNLSDLKLELVSFGSDHDVNSQFKLNINEEQTLNILGQEVAVNEIKTSNNETLVTITSEESLVLTKVYLIIDGERVSLEETIDDKYDKKNDMIMHTRTLRFLDSGNELSLEVVRMTYSKDYNHVIEIPLD